jgi:hypothetical protein
MHTWIPMSLTKSQFPNRSDATAKWPPSILRADACYWRCCRRLSQAARSRSDAPADSFTEATSRIALSGAILFDVSTFAFRIRAR